MKCKLCQLEKPLLRRSHIIPDFMYQGIYDENHFLLSGPVSKLEKMGTVPTGEYERDILCKECDNNVIGKFESYSSRALYGGELPTHECPIFNNITENNLNMTLIKNIDYNKFKLFLLSILWRSSISTRKFFRDVNIGSDEKHIKSLLLSGKGGDYNNYPVSILSLLGYKNIPTSIVTQPHKISFDKTVGFTFLVNGLCYVYFLSSESVPNWLLDISINKSNEMKIIHLGPKLAEKYLLKLVGLKK